jgi:hypothetical protein
MIDAQSPVAIRALPDLCLGIVLQLGHLACRPTWCTWQVRARRVPVAVGAIRKCACLRVASIVRAAISDGSLCAPHAVMNDVRPDGGRRRKRSNFP